MQISWGKKVVEGRTCEYTKKISEYQKTIINLLNQV